jgi:MFS family permease
MSNGNVPTGYLRGPEVSALAAAAFVVSLGYGTLMPVLPGWLAGFDPSLTAASVARYVGELSGIYMLGVFVGALAAGRLSDRVGRRVVLLVGLFVLGLAQLAMVHVSSLMSLYAFRLLAGLSGAAVIPVANALIAEGSDASEVPRRLAYLGAASLFGFLVGPGLVALPRWVRADALIDPAGPAGLFAFAMHATVVVVAVVLLAVWRVASRDRVARLESKIGPDVGAPRFSLFALLTLNFATLLGLSGFEVAVSLYGSQQLRLDTFQVSVMFAECSIGMLLINGLLFLTPFPRALPVRAVLVVSLAAMVTGFVLLDRSVEYAPVLAAVALIAAGSGVAMPVITWAAASHSARLGGVMGRVTAAGSLGQAVGSVAGGSLFALLSARTFLVGAAFMLLALFTAWSAIRGSPTVIGAGSSALRDRTQPPR